MHQLVILIIVFCFCAEAKGTINAKFETFNNGSLLEIHTSENLKVSFNGSLTYSSFTNEQLVLKCWMDYIKVGVMVNWTDIILPLSINENSTIDFNITMMAKRLGGSKIHCSLRTINNFTSLYEDVIGFLIVSRKPTVHEIIYRVIITILIILLTFVMGCGLDPKIVLDYIKQPISPLIGFLSQFLFMPLIAGGLGKLSGIDNAFAFGLLVIGCSPGGGGSNVWTILFGGDLNLSMTMTFISSVSALAMMPFWLFVLGRIFIDPTTLKIPFDSIAINLLYLVIPAGLGMGFRIKWEEKSKLLMRKVKLMGLFFIIFIFTYGTYVNLYVYRLIGDYLYLLPIGAFLPWVGFGFGFVLALVSRRTKTQAIAISLETGFQNIGIPLLILKYSMPQPDGDLGSVMPMVVAMFTPFPLYIGYIFIIIKRKCCKKSPKEKAVIYSVNSEQHEELIESHPK